LVQVLVVVQKIWKHVEARCQPTEGCGATPSCVVVDGIPDEIFNKDNPITSSSYVELTLPNGAKRKKSLSGLVKCPEFYENVKDTTMNHNGIIFCFNDRTGWDVVYTCKFDYHIEFNVATPNDVLYCTIWEWDNEGNKIQSPDLGTNSVTITEGNQWEVWCWLADGNGNGIEGGKLQLWKESEPYPIEEGYTAYDGWYRFPKGFNTPRQYFQATASDVGTHLYTIKFTGEVIGQTNRNPIETKVYLIVEDNPNIPNGNISGSLEIMFIGILNSIYKTFIYGLGYII